MATTFAACASRTWPYTDPDGVLHIRYQDSHTFPRGVASIRDQAVTSHVTGHPEEPDAAVLEVRGAGVYATGCGRATVHLADGTTRTVQVDPSPISLLFVTGQSNASGDHAGVEGEDYSGYIRTQDTMAYYTLTGQALDITGAQELYNPRLGNTVQAHSPEEYVTSTLKWGDDTRYADSYAGVRSDCFGVHGGTTQQAGWSAGLAHEWVAQTGERVWVVNASHGGHPINNFIPQRMGGPELLYNDYEQAVAVFRLALQTLYREVDAGHFTLSRMAYYWFQGESDSAASEDYYTEKFALLHRAIQEDVVYRHAGREQYLEYCGIMTVRSCRDCGGNSEAELLMTGPRLAQYAMHDAKEGLFSNCFVVSAVTEEWVGSDRAVEASFLARYGTKEAFSAQFGYPMPTTRYEVKPGIHYWMQGHNEMGIDAARNSLYIHNLRFPEDAYPLRHAAGDAPATVHLLQEDGYTVIPQGGSVTMSAATRTGYIIPRITPLYRAAAGARLVARTPGFHFHGYRLTEEPDAAHGSVTFDIILGDIVLDTYTLHLSYADMFSASLPHCVHEYGGDFNPPRVEYPEQEASRPSPFSLGYYTYASGCFTAFSLLEDVDSDSWLHTAGEEKWTPHWHGGFFTAAGYAVASSPYTNQAEDTAIRYIAPRAGRVFVQFPVLYPSQADLRIALYHAGRRIYPQEEETRLVPREGCAAAQQEINAALRALPLDLCPGDALYILLSNAGEHAPIAQVYPAIHYLK